MTTTMTTTQPQKLTGDELIEFVENNKVDVLELPKLCGYDSMDDFAENLRQAKETEAQRDKVARVASKLLLMEQLGVTKEDVEEFLGEISKITSTIGGLGYRYLLYQFMLDIEGLDDQRLADQQVEFAEDILRKTKVLKILDSVEAGTIITDTLGVMINLFVYVHASRWSTQEETDSQTREQWVAKVEDYIQWVNTLPLIQEMVRISNIGFDEDAIESYNKQQFRRHTTVATYLRTQIVDYVQGSEFTKTESYLEDLDSACLYTYYLEQNSEWTTDALIFVVAQCIKYDFHSDKEPVEMVQTAIDMIGNMVEAGKAVAEKL
jgi:hypothetical protein